jgi:hypothetical protein
VPFLKFIIFIKKQKNNHLNDWLFMTYQNWETFFNHFA